MINWSEITMTPKTRFAALTGSLAAVGILAVALWLCIPSGKRWDSPPEKYEEATRERMTFRVYGADSIVVPLPVSQNRCASYVVGLKFRTLGTSSVRVYRGGWADFDRIRGTSSPPNSNVFPIVGDLAIANLPREQMVIFRSNGEYQLANGCETLFFSGNPDTPNNLEDVVMDVVTFEPAP